MQEVFRPTLQYLKAEQFDAARTNTNYIMRQLNIKKIIDSLIVSASDDIDDPDLVSLLAIGHFSENLVLGLCRGGNVEGRGDGLIVDKICYDDPVVRLQISAAAKPMAYMLVSMPIL